MNLETFIVELGVFVYIPSNEFCPSIVDIPLCAEKVASQPPESVALLFRDTTSVPVPVYVPVATRMVSPEDALPMAPLIVAQGVTELRQLLLSLPPGDTYQGPAARAGAGDCVMATTAVNARTVSVISNLECVFILRLP